ncbi:MAG: ATP-binding cassette domain-containing protein [Candidatus Hydrogenedentota bacterium]
MAAPANATARLELADLGIDAGGRPLLRHVSLALRAGARVGLLGPSGCGKTTLLRAVAGLIDPACGHVRLRGAEPADYGWPAFRRRVVLIDQQPVLIDATVQANLARPFSYRTASAAFPERRARALLTRLHLEEAVWRQRARRLSIGQQQRVSLVRGLLLDPDALLLDEPTSALDPASAQEVETAVNAAADNGAAVLVVSHDHAQLHRWCDRVVDIGAMTVAQEKG